MGDRRRDRHAAASHVGFAEAICVVGDILGEEAVPVDNSKVPWAIYCQPEVAFAGMSEAAAKEAGIEVVTSKAPIRQQLEGDDHQDRPAAW